MGDITRLAELLRAAGIPVTGVADPVQVRFATDVTAEQRNRAEAIVASFNIDDAVAEAQWRRDKNRLTQQDAIEGGDGAQHAAIRALTLVMLDEINALRAAVNPLLPPRTIQQWRALVRVRIANGSAD